MNHKTTKILAGRWAFTRRAERRTRKLPGLVLTAAMMLLLTACGSSEGGNQAVGDAGGAVTTDAKVYGLGPVYGEEPLLIAATTTILGDIVTNIAGGDARVVVLLPVGADPHDYQPSSAQVALLHEADLVVANGLMLEEGLLDVLAAAELDGVRLFEVGELLDVLPFSGSSHVGDEDHYDGEGAYDVEEETHDEGEEGHQHDHENESHDEGEEGHDHGNEDTHNESEERHNHENEDPHFWMDPLRVAQAAKLIAEELTDIAPAFPWIERAEAYTYALEKLDTEIQNLLSPIPKENRKLVTNHDSLGYFAHRYSFTVIATVIPGGNTLAAPSSANLAALVHTIEEEKVRAVFVETIEPATLAEAVAAESDTPIRVIELYTGSLGGPGSGADTLIGMLRINAERIAGPSAERYQNSMGCWSVECDCHRNRTCTLRNGESSEM